MRIGASELKGLCDYEREAERVREVVAKAASEPVSLVRFLSRYASWNGVFGSGVANLAGKIGRSRALFVEEGMAAPIADRSVLVASYVFDAARDEVDDRDTVHRDTHRCLAQAMIAGLASYLGEQAGRGDLAERAALERLTADPPWLETLRSRAAIGYGLGWPDDRASIFRAIGYHLGSEVLADQEFSTIDTELRSRSPQLVEFLSNRTIELAGEKHVAYQWIRIHSGHGGGAEADHFEWAVRGVHLAFDFTPRAHHDELRERVHEGYLDFARDHQLFFGRVLES